MAFVIETAKKDTDSRSYAERMFFTIQDGEKVCREVLMIDCTKETPKDSEVPDSSIVIMKNYKGSMLRGKKDLLQGETVIFIPSDKGKIILPLAQVAKFKELITNLEGAIYESSTAVND